jgi:uncharacterized Rossmann fold enzyme
MKRKTLLSNATCTLQPGALRNVNTFERFTGADRAGVLAAAAVGRCR